MKLETSCWLYSEPCFEVKRFRLLGAISNGGISDEIVCRRENDSNAHLRAILNEDIGSACPPQKVDPIVWKPRGHAASLRANSLEITILTIKPI
jgi:hypothetical protein